MNWRNRTKEINMTNLIVICFISVSANEDKAKFLLINLHTITLATVVKHCIPGLNFIDAWLEIDR